MKFRATILTIFSISLVSCHRELPNTQQIKETEFIGYILTSEQIDNGYFNNRQFYFFSADRIDSVTPLKNFTKSLDSCGVGFSLYSSYYIRLINSMGIDLISYSIDKEKADPFKLKIEYLKVLPVKLKLEYDPKLKNNSTILKDSFLLDNGTYHSFKYRYIGHAKIRTFEILLPKDDDLSGNEAIMPKRKFGIFGIERK